MADFASPEHRPLPKNCAVHKLIECAPYDSRKEIPALFVSAMREAAEVNFKNAPWFREYWKQHNFSVSDLKADADLAKMPFVFVSAFKERDLCGIPSAKAALELTSSGTSGQKSRMVLDKLSLLRVRRIAWQVFNGLGMADLSSTANSLCLTYDPEVAKNLGTAFTDKLITGLTKRGEVFYAIKWDSAINNFFFDIDGAADTLRRFEKSGADTRLIGFPAHAMMLCDKFKEKFGRYPELSCSSWVITGGGWKDQQDRAVDKQVMRKTLAGKLGLAPEKVRDLFGMVEHGVPYIDCARGNFHIPVYGKIIVRHPATLEPLKKGETGLLQFITPYLSSYPSISLLSSDFGFISECGCGIKTPVLNIAGRAGVKKLKGCAIAASSLL